MRLGYTEEKWRRLKARMEASGDADEVGTDEYVLDLYDAPIPMTLELSWSGGHLCALSCERLSFSEEMDGWYISGAVDDPAAVEEALDGFIGQEP